MNLFELFVKIGVDDNGFKKGINGAKDNFGKFSAWTVAKGQLIADGIKAGGKALIDFGKQAINSYAEYEQLVGGVETLFGAGGKSVEEYAASVGKSVEDVKSEYRSLEFAQQSVMNGAADAYKTAGLSANEYMSTVTSFSAALISSLEGDTNTAAELADRAIIAMSDNANKMGTSMEMIQNAYQGFAKQNYTMLDNLKLGYGGTKTEMQRLIDDANRVREANGEMANLSIESFADIVVAIETMQDKMGISGTTAREAGTTIEGSVNAMKAAWTNLLTGLADGNADIESLVDNLVTTIVGDGTESNLGVLGNIMPAVKTALGGAAKLVSKIVPEIGEQLPGLIGDFLPMLVDASSELMNGLASSLPELLPILIDAIIMATPAIITGIVTAFQSIVAILPDLIQQIADALPVLVPQIVVGLGLMAVSLAQQMPEIFASVANALVNLFAGAWDGIKQVFSLDAVQQFFSSVWDSAKSAFGSVANWFGDVFSDAWQAVKNVFSTGGRIFDGIKDGIVNAFKAIVNGIIGGINKVIAVPFNAINGVLRKIKNVNIVGVKPFDWIQTFSVPQIPKLWRGGVLERGQIGLLEGSGAEAVVPLENNKKWISKVADDMKKSVGGFGGNVYNIKINVEGARYKDEQSLAVAIAQEIQNLTDRRSAVYA